MPVPKILPFKAVRFDWRKVPLAQALCPPYDVIGRELAEKLRAIAHNTIHLELPDGAVEEKYSRAGERCARWKAEGVLVQDDAPAYYVISQRFKVGGRAFQRTGILTALGLDADGLARVLPHEKTFPKAKEDRLNLLTAIKMNTSPIFALYADPRGSARKLLKAVTRKPPAAKGRGIDGIEVKVWPVSDEPTVKALAKFLGSQDLLIADGHHRLEVAKTYFGANPVNGDATTPSTVLCCLCAEEDPGLVVMPTHRVLPGAAAGVLDLVDRLCKAAPVKSLAALMNALKRHPSPFAFGVASPNAKVAWRLAVPKAKGDVPSGLSVEWLAKYLLNELPGQEVRYTHDEREAVKLAEETRGLALLLKPLDVRDIRRAVKRAGLLPQKTTYFYPKVQAGIVFKPSGA